MAETMVDPNIPQPTPIVIPAPQPIGPPPRQDGAILHFLKQLPDRYLLFFCMLIILAAYWVFQSDAILQLLINFAVAIIAISKRPSPETPSQTTNIGTESLATQSMDNATVNVTGSDDPNNPNPKDNKGDI